MKIGDVIETGIWITGDESPEMRTRYESDVTDAVDYFCSQYGFTHGPITFTEKHPMDDKVPEVPDHIQGQRVRLLAVETEITGKALEKTEGSFVNNLDRKDLATLRHIIRRHRQLSNEDCDAIIEEIGPEAALDTLRNMH